MVKTIPAILDCSKSNRCGPIAIGPNEWCPLFGGFTACTSTRSCRDAMAPLDAQFYSILLFMHASHNYLYKHTHKKIFDMAFV